MAVLEQASSGLTIKAFCKQQGLAVHSFYAWRREIRMRDETLETQAVSLVPVTVTDAKGMSRWLLKLDDGLAWVKGILFLSLIHI